jgi:hypothetical protein
MFACRTGVPTRNLINSEALLYQSNFAIHIGRCASALNIHIGVI